MLFVASQSLGQSLTPEAQPVAGLQIPLEAEAVLPSFPKDVFFWSQKPLLPTSLAYHQAIPCLLGDCILWQRVVELDCILVDLFSLSFQLQSCTQDRQHDPKDETI